jgi:A/G-specific adenine glycosylase
MQITKTLTYWYSINKRSLPWRNTKNPYFIWLSEIILQQTQVKQGLPYYISFVEHYPSVFDLANAPEEDVLKLWQGLGYYSRARNLHNTAKFIVAELNGEFPKSYKELIKLKGIGDYTASAIASICFSEVTAVVDGNVYRVLARYYGIHTPINSTQAKKEFKAIAQDIIDFNNPAEFNQAIMEFGAIQCKPKNPDCSICPLKENCAAFNNNQIGLLPVKKKALKPKKKYFNYLVYISNTNETVLEKREGKGIWQNLYQFPLIETNKPLIYTRLRTLLNNNEYDISLYNETDIIHKLSHQHLHTKFWIIKTQELPVTGISIDSIHDYASPVLIKNFIETFKFQ